MPPSLAPGKARTLTVTADAPKAAESHFSSHSGCPKSRYHHLNLPLILSEDDPRQDLWPRAKPGPPRGLFIQVLHLLEHGQPASVSATSWSIPHQKCLSQDGWPTREHPRPVPQHLNPHRAGVSLQNNPSGKREQHALKGFLEVTMLRKERWISSSPPSDFTCVETEAQFTQLPRGRIWMLLCPWMSAPTPTTAGLARLSHGQATSTRLNDKSVIHEGVRITVCYVHTLLPLPPRQSCCPPFLWSPLQLQRLMTYMSFMWASKLNLHKARRAAHTSCSVTDIYRTWFFPSEHHLITVHSLLGSFARYCLIHWDKY